MNEANCKYIESCFRNIKYNKDVAHSLLAISNTIRRDHNIDLTIEVIKNKSNVFFGMNIYPSPDELIRISHALINKDNTAAKVSEEWKNIRSWHVEIDSLLFDDINLDVSPAELTALLLHELGHVVFSDEVPRTTFKVFKLNFFKRDLSFKNIFSEAKLVPEGVQSLVMTFPIIEACSNKTFYKAGYGRGTSAIKKEFYADEFVLKCGYGEALYDFIEKLIMYGQSDIINKSNAEKENDIEIITNWSFDNLNSLVKRRGKLYKSLKVEMKRNPSSIVRDICYRLNTKIFKEPQNDFKNVDTVIMESFIINGLTKASNSFTRLLDKHNRVKPCKMRDLDIFEVEIANIHNVDDKMYVLECLHDELEKAEYALMLLAEGHEGRVTQSKSTIIAYRDMVLKLIKDAKMANIPEERYGLFIKYPKGYEG